MPELFEPSENPTPPDDSQRNEAGTTEENRSEGARPEGVASRREDVRARHMGRDAHGQEIVRRPVSRTQRQVVALAWVAVFFMLLYPLFILLSSFTPGYSFADRIANILLVLGTLFIFIHGLGYANSMIKASLAYDEVKRRVFSPQREPKVVCLITCFNEPLAVLEETVAAMTNMDYGNKEVVILDDSTKEETRQGVRDLALRYGATARQRTNRRGYKAGAINDFLRTTDAPYIAVFDADGLPAHNLLRDLMPIVEENPRLAFVQTPQYYANTDVSNVALAAGRQQSVFYEYISEGKSYSRSAFCCGTNCIFRRDALLAVGGFDETSVTEDFVTSLGLHLKGYDSTYYNQVYAYSMAPETLGAYLTQQGRWAFGSVGGLRRVLKALFTRPGAMSMGQWWEYFLSSTYYWIGWVNFIFMLLPMLYIFFGIKPLRADVFTYLALFVPYLIFSMNMFYTGMEQRGYKVGEMLLGQSIGFLSFPVHMTAAISGILGLKRSFSVTPKDSSGQMSWLSLWPQLLMFVLSAVAVVWGLYQYFMGYRREDSAIVVNVVWALYQTLLLSGIFFLNRGVREARPKRYFSDSQGALYADDDARVRTGSEVSAGAATTSGRISRPPIATPLRPQGRGFGGHVALMLGVLSLLLIVAVGATMIRWAMMPTTPVNVYILDRTAGRDYQEHRMLTWTLNFLKVKKDANLNPSGTTNQSTNYNWAEDYFGFVPAVAPDAQPRVGQGPADIIGGGLNRLLPAELETPGVLYLADTYGEFVEWDPSRNAYVFYQSNPRGVTPEDVDKIQEFYDRNGLVMGEWNTLGYPTLPANAEEYSAMEADLRRGIASIRTGLTFLQNQELPQRERQLQQARASGNPEWQATMEQQVLETRDKIENQRRDLARMQEQLDQRASVQEQLAAQQQLEQILHVDYQGWYGRYVNRFEDQEEFDWRLFKNVNSFDKRRFPNGPKGPGFVFYKDGPSRVFNEQTQKYEENPFSEPIIITQDELRPGSINMASGIYTAGRNALGEDISKDPLLKDVSTAVPSHYWFELVKPLPGSTVLAYYKLMVTEGALDRLRRAGFPTSYLNAEAEGGPQIVFPAAVAYRENGILRSFYMAGDAADYPLVSRIAEMFPSTGGVMSFLSGRFGSFSSQYYWNYYYPMMKNVLTETESIRSSGGRTARAKPVPATATAKSATAESATTASAKAAAAQAATAAPVS